MPRKTLRVRKLISILKKLDPDGEVFIFSKDDELVNARVSPISYKSKDDWVQSMAMQDFPNKGVLLWS